MGAVYKYRNPAIDKFVAIKMLSVSRFSDSAHLRFLKEGQAASRLIHPNLLTVHDLGLTEQNEPYMVMDYFEGQTLADLLKHGVQLTNEQLKQIFVQCCDGMYYAHENSVLHRDLKPSNIMVTGLKSADVRAVIFDFGISKLLDDPGTGVTRAGEVFGSPMYMSPEQCDGGVLDVRSDIYSLGCTFYEILSGTPPFVGDSLLAIFNAHKIQKPLPLKEASLGRDYPPEFSAAVSKMLEKDPQNRPQSMVAVKQILLGLDSKSGHSVNSATKKSWAPYLVLAILIGVIIGVTCYFLTRSDAPQNLSPAPSFPDYRVIEPKKEAILDQKTDATFFHSQISNQSSEVHAEGMAITDSDLNMLTEDPQVRALMIENTAITDAGFKTIAKIKELVRLNADHTKITTAGVKTISSMPNLTYLNLSENNIGDASLPYIAKLTKLRELTLRGTKITDEGLRKLAPLKNLQMIQLNRTVVSDEGVKYICETFPNLRELHIRQNVSVTDKSLQYIASAPRLVLLTINGSNITPRLVRNFFITHPRIKDVQDAGERTMAKFIDVLPN